MKSFTCIGCKNNYHYSGKNPVLCSNCKDKIKDYERNVAKLLQAKKYASIYYDPHGIINKAYHVSPKLSDLFRELIKELGIEDEVKTVGKDYHFSDSIYRIKNLSIRSDVAKTIEDILNELTKAKKLIYNEGLNEGSSLLVGLNNGSLSLKDFEKEIKNKDY